jgi:hypothetical protein
MATSRRVLWVRDSRGARGGTTTARWLIGNARQHGRAVQVYDLDRNHTGLVRWHPDAIRPKGAAPSHVQDALTEAVNAVARTGVGAVVDMGGGDGVGRAHAEAIDLVGVCEGEGVGLNVFVPLGPSRQDVDAAIELAESGVYLPGQIVLVPNLGLGDGQVSAEERFAPLLDRKEIAALCAEGMEIAEMPALLYAVKVEDTGVDFWAAEAGQGDPCLGPAERGDLRMWLHGRPGRGAKMRAIPGMAQNWAALEAAGRTP